MKLLVATVATVTALGVPSVAQAATLTAEPSLPCYREEASVFLPGGAPQRDWVSVAPRGGSPG